MSDQVDRLIAHYQKALLIKSNNAEVYIYLAEVYYKKGQLDEAIAAYNCAIDLKPDAYKAYYRLGKILQELQRWQEAIYCYLQVIYCYQECFHVEQILVDSYYKLIVSAQ
ncbi:MULTISPECIES: tetratricopeptide repeat protein [unclassified Microcoleus]|uniref:tetratricopeptide repeat protein n=1 Tax=unclassified Microcoleus TaxID=2642155 RepID=UPI0025E49B56|nr:MULTISPECIES: tetratricopeptide repeat protein [unclassified Microcoleus]